MYVRMKNNSFCAELDYYLLSSRIIDFTTDDFYSWRGSFYAVLLFLASFSEKLISNNAAHLLCITFIQFQSALMGAIFRKVSNI